MQKAINFLKAKETEIIKIEAQTYLLGFYKKLGFRQIGKEFDLDGIPHIEMELRISN